VKLDKVIAKKSDSFQSFSCSDEEFIFGEGGVRDAWKTLSGMEGSFSLVKEAPAAEILPRRELCKSPVEITLATCRPMAWAPQHFLYFFPLPQEQGSFRPTSLFILSLIS